MRALTACLLAATLLSSWPANALAQSPSVEVTIRSPTVRTVDLGQSGIALYGLVARASDEPVRLAVPAADGDDVLASLVVGDPAGGVAGVRTATPGAEAARDALFPAGAPTSAAALLRALVGRDVSLRSGDATVRGRLLGVEPREIVAGDVKVTRPVAMLFDGTIVRDVVIEPGVQVTPSDDAGRALGAALDRAARPADTRTFEIALEGTSPREIALSYVTPAPAWKNSWRLLLDEGRLQGWATVENVSGQDWRDVSLTLSTGAPVAFERDLLSLRRIARAAAPDLLGERPQVEADRGFAAPSSVQAELAPRRAESRMAPGADASAPAMQAVGANGVAATRYTVPEPVTIAAGRTANIPYIEVSVDPKVRALHRVASPRDLVLAASIAADRPLAPGLVSIRDANGFAGDAPFAGMDAGQTRLLPYAALPNANVRTETIDGEVRIDVRAEGDLLEAQLRTRRTSTFAVELDERVDLFTVELPDDGADFVSANGEVERRDGLRRVSVPVADGSARVEVVAERVRLQRITREGEGLRDLLRAVAAGATIDEADRTVLEAAAGVLKARDLAEGARRDLDARYERLTREQARLRENLAAVGEGPLRQRYLATLSEREDSIEQVLSRIEAANAAVAKLNSELSDTVARFR